jgi:hypothetical protein
LQGARRRENYDSGLRDLIGRLDYAGLESLSILAAYSDPEVYSRLVVLRRGASGLPVYDVVSTYVRELITEAFLSNRWEELCKQFSELEEIQEMSTAMGWLWDGYCQVTIPTMATLDVEMLADNGVRPDDSTRRLANMPSNVIRILNVEAVQDGISYSKSRSRTKLPLTGFSSPATTR